MIAAIVPQFFSSDLHRTLAYYRDTLGFETQFEYGEPAFYAGAIRDGLSIFFRHLDAPPPLPPNKFDHELLDAYLRVEDVARLHDELAGRGVTFFRDMAAMPWLMPGGQSIFG